MRGGLVFVAIGFLTGCLGGGTRNSFHPEGGAVLLRLDPPVGQATRYRTVTESTSAVAGPPGSDQLVTVRQTVFATDSVYAAAGGIRHVLSTTDSIRMETSGPSTSPDRLAQLAEKLKGSTTDLRITTKGEVLAWDTPESLGIPEEGKATSFLQQNAGALVLPEEAIRAGYTWEAPWRLPVAQGGMTMRIQYRFDGVETRDGARLARISLSGPVEMRLPMDLVLLGEILGGMEIDLGNGRITMWRMQSTASSSSEFMGIPITMTMESKMEKAILR